MSALKLALKGGIPIGVRLRPHRADCLKREACLARAARYTLLRYALRLDPPVCGMFRAGSRATTVQGRIYVVVRGPLLCFSFNFQHALTCSDPAGAIKAFMSEIRIQGSTHFTGNSAGNNGGK